MMSIPDWLPGFMFLLRVSVPDAIFQSSLFEGVSVWGSLSSGFVESFSGRVSVQGSLYGSLILEGSWLEGLCLSESLSEGFCLGRGVSVTS